MCMFIRPDQLTEPIVDCLEVVLATVQVFASNRSDWQ